MKLDNNSFENKKQLEFNITLGTYEDGSKKTFKESSTNSVNLTGHRAIVDITNAGELQMGIMRCRIYGVNQDDMNTVTTLQWKNNVRIANKIECYAIDGENRTLIYAGNIVNAWADYNTMPDVFLHIQAQTAFQDMITASPARSFKDAIAVEDVMKQIAYELGYGFENSGVHKIVSNVALKGSSIDQIRGLSTMAGISFSLENNVLAIWQRDQGILTVDITPPTEEAIEISAQTGMIGYPTFDGSGIATRVLFNPKIKIGARIRVTSQVDQANGIFIVQTINHQLASEMPNAPWHSYIRSNVVGFAPT